MTFPFEEDNTDTMAGYEFDESDQPSYDMVAAAQVVEQLQSPPPRVPEVEEKMNNVQTRMRVAHYMMLLLDNRFFEDDVEAAYLVESMVKGFLTTKLEELVGVAPAKQQVQVVQAEPQFSEEEVAVLKSVAKVVLEKQHQQNQAPVKPKRESPPRKVPAKVQQQAAPAPKAAPVAPKASSGLRKVGSQPGAQRRQFQPPPPNTGSSLLAKLPESVRADGTMRIVDGKVLIQSRTSDGEPLHYDNGEPVLKDVTPQATPAPGSPPPLPTLSVDQFNMISAQSAASQTQRLANTPLGSVVVTAQQQ
jgi:hypothetical protein